MKKTVQVPSVGRVVHYRSRGIPHLEIEGGCHAAVVTAVQQPAQPDSVVALCVMTPYEIKNIRGIMHGDDVDQWHWPEFTPPIEIDDAEGQA